MKYKTVSCEGYWASEPDRIYPVTIALGSWDGVEDAEDEGIFHYMDGEPLELGTNLTDGFVITGIDWLECAYCLNDSHVINDTKCPKFEQAWDEEDLIICRHVLIEDTKGYCEIHFTGGQNA